MRKTMPFARRELPPLARMKQNLPTDHIKNVHAEVRRQLFERSVLKDLTKGSRVAITAGSRGMGGFVELLTGWTPFQSNAEELIVPVE